MDFKVNIDTDRIQREMQTTITQKMLGVVQHETSEFFGKRGYLQNGKIVYEKGSGLKEVEELIANKFLSPQFTQDMNAYFEENWKRIFEECMRTALQHKANAVVFAKVKATPEPER